MLFTTAKALGFDMTIILSMMVVALMLVIFAYVMVKKFLSPFSQGLDKLTSSVEALTQTLREHVEKFDKRLDEGDARFLKIEKQLYDLENRGDKNG